LVGVMLSDRSGGNKSARVFLWVGWTWIWEAGAYDGRGAGGIGRDGEGDGEEACGSKSVRCPDASVGKL
jgi:hypothetical protein